jgi:P2-related tail formation protein
MFEKNHVLYDRAGRGSCRGNIENLGGDHKVVDWWECV